ncbi:MAG: hypothetical protein RL328_2643 [Acidobacteriota bacterium]|jgi:hypothetical protein
MGESTSDYREPPGFCLGAKYRPAPAGTPLLRASLAAAAPPPECRWDRLLDLTGDDGAPDALGNDAVGNCVPVAALRQMQLWTGDGRKPTRNHAMALLRAWGGTPEGGTYTDEAFTAWGAKGYQWGEQRQIVPRWTLVEQDGVNPNLQHLKRGIHALGGVLAVFDMPEGAMTYDPWTMPAAGAASVGHHCVLLAGYDLGAFYAVSWGRVIPVGYAFLIARLRQASAFASDAWVRPDGQGGARTPSGLSADELRAVGAQVEGT